MGGRSLTDRVALIVGGSGDLGRALVKAYAEVGHRVAIHYHEGKGRAEELTSELGENALAIQADLRDEGQIERMFSEIVLRFGRLDVLANAAGLYDDAVVWKMDVGQWDDVLDVNLKGTYLATKHAIPIMRSQSYGRIVHLSSVVGHTGVFGTSNYAAAKAGIAGFTRSVAREVARHGITINALVLGYVRAGMYLRLPGDLRASIETRIPLGRPAEVGEVTAAALFLTSPEASYVTGQEIHMNGGYFP